MVIGWLMGAGLSRTAARLVSIVGVILLIGLAVWWLRADAYNDGVKATDRKWEEAGEKLEQDAAKAAGTADAASVKRIEAFTEKQAAEKERIDEAERAGNSPFDVLFGPGDGLRN